MMNDLVAYTANVFMGFLAIMNPLANTPVFLGLTSEDAPATRGAVARRALLAAFAIVAVFVLGGNLIFELFGITLPAFRIAGGILVFGIGYDMLGGSPSRAHKAHDATPGAREAQLSVAISPLAVPILAGPGTIATAMSFVAERTLIHVLATLGTFAVVCLISYVSFVSGERLIRYIGVNAVSAVTRMMGLILAVIGVQMFIEGVHGAVALFR
jgi:multiple antibiotic resistance protein